MFLNWENLRSADPVRCGQRSARITRQSKPTNRPAGPLYVGMGHRRGEAARSGPQEFREFMRDRGSPLHQVAYPLCGGWHLVQETLVKAGNPDAYVRRILSTRQAAADGTASVPCPPRG